MIIPFNAMKTVQAAAVLLKEHAGKMSRLRLLKLLYIADRESIAETLRPITGDDVAAMDHGPVLSETYNLIKQRANEAPLWNQFIKPEGDKYHVLAADPGISKLSEYDIMKLRSVSAMRQGMKDYEIADETHKFQEWKKNQPPEGSSQPIPVGDVLAALHMGTYRNKLDEEQEAETALDELLESVG